MDGPQCDRAQRDRLWPAARTQADIVNRSAPQAHVDRAGGHPERLCRRAGIGIIDPPDADRHGLGTHLAQTAIIQRAVPDRADHGLRLHPDGRRRDVGIGVDNPANFDRPV